MNQFDAWAKSAPPWQPPIKKQTVDDLLNERITSLNKELGELCNFRMKLSNSTLDMTVDDVLGLAEVLDR